MHQVYLIFSGCLRRKTDENFVETGKIGKDWRNLLVLCCKIQNKNCDNNYCLLRYRVEINSIQSFLSAIASIYNLTTLLIIMVIICLIYFLIRSEKYEKIIYSIIVGGALGNFYDRMFFKAVPDFIDLHYKNFHWFTFNLADIFITLGIIAFLFKEIFKANQ